MICHALTIFPANDIKEIANILIINDQNNTNMHE